MKLNKKSMVALLTLLALLVSFSACGNPDLKLATDGETEYVIVRPEQSSTTINSAAIKLKNAINKATGADISVISDTEDRESSDGPEILIGKTNRTLNNDNGPLKEKEFSIFVDGSRLVFMGGSDESVLDAVLFFIDNHLEEETEKLRLKGDFTHDYRHDYPINALNLGTNSIGMYSVVIPEEATAYEIYTAEFLINHIYQTVGYRLELVEDSEEESDYEILIGATNRSASVQAGEVSLGETEYIFGMVDKKLVIAGDGYLVAGGAGELINKHIVVQSEGADINLEIGSELQPKELVFEEAKSVILMIGDGMGFNQVKITELDGLGQFSASFLPNKGSMTTVNVFGGVTDSAAAGTALATGYKTANSRLGLDKDENVVENVRELAERKGGMTGVITTDYIHGATPGAFLVHHRDRANSTVIKEQIEELNVDYLGGYVGNNLLKSTKECLALLSEGDFFFLMIEESEIDPAGHANNHDWVIRSVKRFDESIIYAMVFTVINPETVLIVTADHETGGLTERDNGSFEFTTGGHSSAPVPVYAIGKGTEMFDDTEVDNTDVAKFIASVYGETNFGQE